MSSRKVSKNSPPPECVIAAIDIGTNSVHMVVARASAIGFDVLTSEKEMVRLGTGGGKFLTAESMERCVTALRRMKDIADAYGAKIRAVATSAVREAENAETLIHRIHTEVGIDANVISGSEEARLIFVGVSNCLPLRDDSILMIDIGGGSTEFSISRSGHLKFVQSLKLGAVRLTEKFIDGSTLTKENVAAVERHISSKISLIAHDLRASNVSRVILSSGTCETLARMAALRRTGSIPQSMNGFVFSSGELFDVTKEILECSTAKQRAGLAGIDSKRSDIIAAGAMILREIAESVDIKSFEYSDYSLREGVLFDTIDEIYGRNSTADASMDSVLRLAQRCSVDMAHSAHVAKLGQQLFRELTAFYDFDPAMERLLVAASYLANSGAAISYTKHHLHSYYIIRNGDLLGFTDDEIETVALIARYHRKSGPNGSHADFAQISVERQEEVEILSAILRLATALDRSHDQSVETVRVSMSDAKSQSISSADDTTVRISVASKATSHHHMSDLNLYTARDRTSFLADCLGAKVEIVAES